MNLKRLIKTLTGKVETYEASFECSKPLDEVLEVVRHFREKTDFWLGAHTVLKDVKNFGYYEIGKGPAKAPNPRILWHFTIMFMNGVAYQVKLRLETCCPKIVFEEFKALVDKIPDVQKQEVVVEEEVKIENPQQYTEIINGQEYYFDESTAEVIE